MVHADAGEEQLTDGQAGGRIVPAAQARLHDGYFHALLGKPGQRHLIEFAEIAFFGGLRQQALQIGIGDQPAIHTHPLIFPADMRRDKQPAPIARRRQYIGQVSGGRALSLGSCNLYEFHACFFNASMEAMRSSVAFSIS